jgi:hypothetical protein
MARDPGAFHHATQIGLTATPKETEDVSNINYFGDPVYSYSLKQSIRDGFLAPLLARTQDRFRFRHLLRFQRLCLVTLNCILAFNLPRPPHSVEQASPEPETA